MFLAMIAVMLLLLLLLPSSDTPTHCQKLHMKSKTQIDGFNELYQAVAKVGDWTGLCLNLVVDEAKMNELKYSASVHEHKKQECLQAYLNTGEANWENVIQAVAAYPICNVKLAKEIANSRNITYSHSASDEL